MREYKTGSRWAFWRWTITDSSYLTRLFLIKSPWFSICLHWLNHPDPEPFQHDHPVTFISFILRGWYIEKRYGQEHLRYWFNVVRFNQRHTIVKVGPRTLTLAFMGPKRQDWGFFTANGKVGWQQYHHTQRIARG